MLDFLGKVVIGYIEKEVIASAPELENLIIAQLEKLANVILDFVKSKVQDSIEN